MDQPELEHVTVPIDEQDMSERIATDLTESEAKGFRLQLQRSLEAVSAEILRKVTMLGKLRG